MILGVDHIALSCEDVVHGAKLLGEAGYRVKFIQEGLSNHPTKRPLLKLYAPLHSVAYCQAEGAGAVELTQHASSLCDAASPYQVLLSGFPSNATPFKGDLPFAWENTWRAALGCGQPMAAQWDSFHAQFWYDAQHNEPSSGLVRALLVPVTDLSVSEKFWVEGLGCRLVRRSTSESGHSWAHVAFRGPVRAWSLDVVLVESDRIGVLPYLDDPGFPCLALITNRLTEDKAMALKMGGHEGSGEFEMEVGNKLLNVVILRGPDNELVEMIQVYRR